MKELCAVKVQLSSLLVTVAQPPKQPEFVFSYPFIPPTTFSGYLARVYLISKHLREGNKDSLSMLREHITERGEKHSPLLLTKFVDCIVLGAYPITRRIGDAFTYRQGSRLGILGDEDRFKFIRFKRDMGRGTRYWLIRWQWRIFEELTGYVLSKSSIELEKMNSICGYGFKIGYEGFTFVKDIKGPYELQKATGKYLPSVPLVLSLTRPFSVKGNCYTLYRYKGYDPEGPEYECCTIVIPEQQIQGDFYINEKAKIYIPIPTVEFLAYERIA